MQKLSEIIVFAILKCYRLGWPGAIFCSTIWCSQKHYQIIMKTFPTIPQRFFINHVHDPRVPLVGQDKHIGLLRRALTMLLGILISNGMSYRFYGDTKIPLPCMITPKPHAVRVVRDLSAKQIANVLPDLILIVHIWDET